MICLATNLEKGKGSKKSPMPPTSPGCNATSSSPILNEELWLRDASTSIPVCSKPTTVDAAKWLINIKESTDSNIIIINNRRVDKRDIDSLFQEAWLTTDIISVFMSMIMEDAKSKNMVIVEANNLDIDVFFGKTTHSINDLKGLKIIFSMHVGRNGYKTFLSNNRNVGNHYALGVYDYDTATFILADSLGWALADEMYHFISQLNSKFHGSAQVAVQYCHPPANNGAHTCNELCMSYPKQVCGNACGLATLLGMVFCVYETDTFPNLSHRYSYLCDLTSCSNFVRLVLID